jgi:serine/threonine protein phosphatase 1
VDSLQLSVSTSSVHKPKPRTPNGTRIYAIGDVHGRADLLGSLLARIDSDLKAYPVARSVQVFLGDYIDRGPCSRQVIDLLVARRRRHTVLYLKGNHETLAAEFLNNPSVLTRWQQMGGASTLLSYGISAAPHTDPG